MKDIPLKWQIGFSHKKDVMPDEYVSAAVPGAAQMDWAAAKSMPDWNYGVNYREYKWMEDVYWIYKTDIPRVDLKGDEQLIFRCLGVDYEYEVLVNGEAVYAYEGMFKPFELDLTGTAGSGGELIVIICPVPKNPDGEPDTRQEASSSCKPAVSYGWDWHPRLVPTGIWDEATLRVVKKKRIMGAEVFYTLSEDLKRAYINVDAKVYSDYSHSENIAASECDMNAPAAAGCAGNITSGCAGNIASGCAENIAGSHNLRFRLFSPDGGLALEAADARSPMVLPDVRLWWCNGYGEPALYSWELLLEKDGDILDKASGKIGFRKITLEMTAGTIAEPADFPKSRYRAPITVTLNGTPVFAKGTNWVNPEIFPGKITADTYRPLLSYAKDANMNLLRVWGGGIVNKESFFDLCDSYGLMVWQEFPLACNKYPDTEQYLNTLESEAAAIILRLRKHASLAIWCGGNELFNNWSMMNDQSLPLRLLNKLCYEMDKGRPYLPTSPVDGMAHGCYLFVYPDGREVYEAMAEARYTAYTEFGMPSVSNMETCLEAAPRDSLFPLVKNEATVAHHAFHAWEAEDSWCSVGTIGKYFGEPASLEQLIERSQWMQCEGYKCIYEEARRQKPYCSMALNWCYNEPWPTIANNSLLNYPANPKPAYAAVAQSCRNRLASARLPKFAWKPGEEFIAELWLLNDGQSPIGAGVAEVYAEYGGARYLLLKWDYEEVPANNNLAGPTIRHIIKNIDCDKINEKFIEFKLMLMANEMSSEYRLIIHI